MKYIEDSQTIELSLDELVLRACRGGDLGTHFGFASSDMGRKLKNSDGMFYLADVEMSNTSVCDGIYYTVTGKADGVIKKDGKITVDVNCSASAFEFSAKKQEAVLTRLKALCYFAACRHELQCVFGRVSCSDERDEKIRPIHYTFEFGELCAWYKKLLQKISRQGHYVKQRCEEILPSAASCVFPYGELRAGQEIMIRECYSAIRSGQRLFVQAPTGTGKTISALYPAVRAIGRGLADKIFYLTAKSSTRREAYRAAERLFEGGARLRTVVITAKEQACMNPSGVCCKSGMGAQGMSCENAHRYYDRCDDAIFELLSLQNGFSPSIIQKIAKKYRVCPYELSLDLSEYCDIVICDYNYVFDPIVYLRRYFTPCEDMGRYIFLVDEAHNLSERAREMYSANVRLSLFESLYAEIDTKEERVSAPTEKLIRAIRGAKKLCRDDLIKSADGEERGFYLGRSIPANIHNALEEFRKKIAEYMRKEPETPYFARLDASLSEVRRFLNIAEYFDERFLFYVEVGGDDILLRIYCLDPSHIMDIIQNKARSTVMFSATLTPADYFCDVLGADKRTNYVSLPSPFDSDNCCVAIADYLSLRLEDRAASFAKYSSVIAATVSAKQGNYIVYFPSYDCLEGVYRVFTKKYPHVKIIKQSKNMTQQQKESFIASFKEDTGTLRIGFCVLGGSFSEGVDLPGSRLIGVVIFGTGLPGLSNEKNIIRDYYELKNGCGYDYAYTFPGMNNVLQAAGRVIRQDDDRGVIVLCDDRYATEKHIHLFPEHWKNIKFAGNSRSLAEILRNFWK